MGHPRARPPEAGREGRGGLAVALRSLGAGSAPPPNSCVLAQAIILPRFTKPLVGQSGCQALWVQDCVWGTGASKRNGQRPWPQDLTDQMALHTPASLQACRTIGGRCPAGVDMCRLEYDPGLGLSEPHRWLGEQSWPADPGPQHHVHCFLPPDRGSLCVCVAGRVWAGSVGPGVRVEQPGRFRTFLVRRALALLTGEQRCLAALPCLF